MTLDEAKAEAMRRWGGWALTEVASGVTWCLVGRRQNIVLGRGLDFEEAFNKAQMALDRTEPDYVPPEDEEGLKNMELFE